MHTKTIELKTAEKACRFIECYCEQSGITVARTDTPSYTSYLLSHPTREHLENRVADICGKLAVWFFKPRIVAQNAGLTSKQALPAALLGAVAAYREDEEIALVGDKTRDSCKINVNGLITFMLTDLITEWNELAALTSRLYAQCVTDGETIELVSFLLSLENSRKSTVKMVSPSLVYADGEQLIPIEIFDTPSLSALYTSILARPASIVIASPQAFSTDVVEVIKSLGVK